MGTKTERFEESTKIHSASELDEILQKARARPVLADEDYDDFEEHTIIGPAQELAAKSMDVPDPAAPPVVPRASTNVIRRTGPVVAARASDVIAVPAVGSETHIPVTEPRAPSDEDAFEPWDDFVDAKPAPAPPEPPVVATAPQPIAVPTPAPMALPLAPPIAESALATTMPAAVVEPPADDGYRVSKYSFSAAEVPATALKKPMRWGMVAWIVLAVMAIGAGGFAYQRITELERELAQTKAALEAARK